jgi:hypothetical protein
VIIQNSVHSVPETAPAIGESGEEEDIIEMTRNRVYGVPLMHGAVGQGQDPTTTIEYDADQEDPAYEYIL